MLGTLTAVLLVLWVLGYVQIPWLRIPNFHFFSLNGHPITLWNILIFFAILWAIDILPSPVKQIIVAFLLLWLLSVLGIIVVAGLQQLVIIAIVIGLVYSLSQEKKS